MKEVHGLIGIVKYAAEQSGRKYVIGMEGWKTLIVNNVDVWMWSTGIVPTT